MKILVLNAGSSSHKCCLYEIENALSDRPPAAIWEAQIDWEPAENSAALAVKTAQGKNLSEKLDVTSRRDTLSYLLNTLSQGETQVVSRLEEIDIVGHRVVHGAQAYQSSVVITSEVKEEIARFIPLAPNHNPANLEGIELMEQLLADIPQVAVFDTAFHSQMPPVAATYPGPYDWLEKGIRRYGFHGISHQYCMQRAAQILNRDQHNLRLIICHLGNGGSLCAVRQGQSIDTTMGFTPLDGLMMGTRSGAVDPGILIYLMRQGHSADELDHQLNAESGLSGISGVSHDLRAVAEAALQGSQRAQLAKDLYLHRLKACMGSMLMSLGGVDAIVFTAGIGENSAWVREHICASMAFLGLSLDHAKNESKPVDQDIATANSAVRALVIHTQEDWAIAQACWQLLSDRA